LRYPRVVHTATTTGCNAPANVLIVVDRARQAHANNLMHAAGPYAAVSWCFTDEFEERLKVSKPTHHLFVGETKYGQFFRKLATPTYRQHGAVWCTHKLTAMIYAEDTVIDARGTLPKVREALTLLTRDADDRCAFAGTSHPTDRGAHIAYAYATLSCAQPALHAERGATSERDVRDALHNAQIVLGLTAFLLNGWSAFCLMRPTRTAPPGTPRGHSVPG